MYCAVSSSIRLAVKTKTDIFWVGGGNSGTELFYYFFLTLINYYIFEIHYQRLGILLYYYKFNLYIHKKLYIETVRANLNIK